VAAGQVLGGVLVSANLLGTGWRPVFLVNVPAGLAVLAFAGRLPAGGKGEAGRERLDLAGAGWPGAGILGPVVPRAFRASRGWPGPGRWRRREWRPGRCSPGTSAPSRRPAASR